MSITTNRGGDDKRNERSIRQLLAPTPPLDLGTGTEVGVIPDDAAITAATTVADLRSQVVALARMNRWLARELSRKQILSVEV